MCGIATLSVVRSRAETQPLVAQGALVAAIDIAQVTVLAASSAVVRNLLEWSITSRGVMHLIRTSCTAISVRDSRARQTAIL